MKSLKSLIFASCLALLAIGLSGCARTHEDDLYARNNRDVNILGIVNYAPESYRNVPNTSASVRSNEVVARKNISGNNLSLLWGAVVFADY